MVRWELLDLLELETGKLEELKENATGPRKLKKDKINGRYTENI